MSKLWEIDPETRSKLQAIQKKDGNNRCVDCNAPSPQWCSPKLGIFFCLSCSGIHRSLGVHISFVRSVTMDSFKVAEVQRMDKGGNNPWKEFFDAHKSNKLEGRTFDDSTIQERYDSEAGEEWKERLTCKVEGREFDPAAIPKKTAKPVTDANSGSRSATPTSGSGDVSQKAQNEAYFARMGQENSSRPDGVAPSQGGKYTGFGSAPPEPARSNGSMPSADEFQKDPVAALTKGFGWFSSTVSKQATAGYTGWVKPNVQKLAEGDLADKARQAAAQVGQTVTAGTKTAADSFNRFVEGENGHSGSAGAGTARDPEKRDFWDSFGEAPKGPSADKRDFWDSFAAAGDVASNNKAQTANSSIGTSAMKKGPAGKKEDGGWGDW